MGESSQFIPLAWSTCIVATMCGAGHWQPTVPQRIRVFLADYEGVPALRLLISWQMHQRFVRT